MNDPLTVHVQLSERSYEIVIGKRDGKIQVEGRGFTALSCLKFLGRLKLGCTVEEKLEAAELYSMRGQPVNQCLRSDDGKGEGGQ